MNVPKISVLIPTYNRAPFLKEVLDSLITQTLPNNQYEIIVIDDGSSDNTNEVVASFQEKLLIHYAYQENQGISVAKNRAIDLAKAPIVLFMDDDDIADPCLLAEHLGTHEMHPNENIAVLGFTDLRKDVASSPLMHFVTEVGYYLFCYPKIKHGEVLDYTYFWGGRSSCKKSLLLKKGMFDPVFNFGSEDIELGARLSKYDFRVIYNKKAHTTMIRTMSLDNFCQRVERQGFSNWIFGQKHQTPEIKLLADITDIDVRWDAIKEHLNDFKKCASGLEGIVQARKKYGVEIDDFLLSLLYNAYWNVFDGYRLKGSWTARQQSKEQNK